MRIADHTKHSASPARVRVNLRGVVQGVGFRPFVFRLANELGLEGWVNNSPQGVLVEAEGPRVGLEQFLFRLESEKPVHSDIQTREIDWLAPVGLGRFTIRDSEKHGNRSTLMLPDLATCPDCLRELNDPGNRRYRYPFTNCTHCGPRFSIIQSLPYDRANTSMSQFRLCPVCSAEYHAPNDRRFHAQPNACPECGPKLELWPGMGVDACLRRCDGHERPRALASGHDALLAAAHVVRCGQIVAVKGLGGFHLLVDARNAAAVRRLRERKHREEKPFAVMVPSLTEAKRLCEVSLREEQLLASPAAPIVLLSRHSDGLSELVAPRNPNLGLMLPANPLHHLLMTELGFPVVATSGNASDEPICTDELEALHRLTDIADVFLVHDRPIVRPVDDSIVRVMAGREMILRRARGYAPLPIRSRSGRGDDQRTVLAVGAHLKNTVALAVGERVFVSQHLGDLETTPANEAFRRASADLPRIYQARPEVVVCDLHPDYLSTRLADELCRGDGSNQAPRKLPVQHHIAHVLACLAENDVQLPALGVAWDGTGYGTDGTIWGGEFFRVTDQRVERMAHLRPFGLPGGDSAVKEPRRAAIGALFELWGESAFVRIGLPTLMAFPGATRDNLRTMLTQHLNTPRCSSAGRLFDAVASILGVRQETHFEGQAAMELEHVIKNGATGACYPLTLQIGHAPLVLDWGPMLEAMVADLGADLPIGEISAKFHNTLARSVVTVARHLGESRVLLSGGCFQNRYLLEQTVTRLRAAGLEPFWHRQVPTNDGGVALGQVVAARREPPTP